MQNPEEIIKNYVRKYIANNEGENIDNEVMAFGFRDHMINTDEYHIILNGDVCFKITGISDDYDLPKEIHVKWDDEFMGDYSVHSHDGDELREERFIDFNIKL